MKTYVKFYDKMVIIQENLHEIQIENRNNGVIKFYFKFKGILSSFFSFIRSSLKKFN